MQMASWRGSWCLGRGEQLDIGWQATAMPLPQVMDSVLQVISGMGHLYVLTTHGKVVTVHVGM
jgi:hypothetical protein